MLHRSCRFDGRPRGGSVYQSTTEHRSLHHEQPLFMNNLKIQIRLCQLWLKTKRFNKFSFRTQDKYHYTRLIKCIVITQLRFLSSKLTKDIVNFYSYYSYAFIKLFIYSEHFQNFPFCLQKLLMGLIMNYEYTTRTIVNCFSGEELIELW